MISLNKITFLYPRPTARLSVRVAVVASAHFLSPENRAT